MVQGTEIALVVNEEQARVLDLLTEVQRLIETTVQQIEHGSAQFRVREYATVYEIHQLHGAEDHWWNVLLSIAKKHD